MVNESVDFTTLKDLLNTSDGNLASHLSALEKNDLITVHKKFVERKPNTSYQITGTGRQAFLEHLDYLSRLVKTTRLNN